MDKADERSNEFRQVKKKKKKAAPEKCGIIWKIKHIIETLRKSREYRAE